MRHILRIAFLIVLFVLPSLLFAQTTGARSYDYASIDFDFHVNPDASVDVVETQTYRFTGTYHQGWRSIPLRGTDGIDQVTVKDVTRNIGYTFSKNELDKEAPASWGAFTTKRENGNLDIVWYFDASDETRVFELRYRLLGAVTFMDEHDEFYWNLFTDFTVPIERVTASVILPPTSSVAPFTHAIYVDPSSIPSSSARSDERTFFFTAENVPPQGKVTIAPGWPKGAVDQGAYIRHTLFRLSPFILALLTLLGTIGYAIWYWYEREGKWRRHETIIPMYEAPAHLPPAMIDYITNERLAPKAWSATVVDLAVRGFLSIDEDVKTGMFSWAKTREYTVKKTRAFDETLATFEKAFIDALCVGGADFSTREMKTSISKGRLLQAQMQKIEKDFLAEVETKTHAYEVTPVTERSSLWVFVALILVFFLGIPLIGAMTSIFSIGTVVFFFSVATSIGIVYLVQHDSRLNETGRALRRECLGFKMYLATAERFRLQNLTPETFEKFLSYAMIFGIEKKWARAFENISVPPPSWYHSTASSSFMGAGGGATSGFSPGAFATGFSSSFSSAFASSGGGGASGGGGSAGGGGGGGGGGAS
jgi:uncharacterized membrane protein